MVVVVVVAAAAVVMVLVVIVMDITMVMLFTTRNCADFNTQSLGRNCLVALEETAAARAAASNR